MTVSDSGSDGVTHRRALPAALRLGPVTLQVSSLERSLAYYTGVLGLRPLRAEPGRALLGGNDAGPLVELRKHRGARPVPPRGRLGLYHFAILLPDRPVLGRLVRQLSERGERFGASDHLVSEALYLRDPDGLGIEVYADRPRDAWRTHQTLDGAELLMVTDPLNLADLVRAAGNGSWDGMPEGTVMGHLHLHVGDLGIARDFYHRALGLDPMVWSYPGALFMSAGGYHHHLGVNTWAGEAAVAPSADDARLVEWTILLPQPADVSTTAERLTSAGYPLVPTQHGWHVSDPWGTVLRVTSGDSR